MDNNLLPVHQDILNTNTKKDAFILYESLIQKVDSVENIDELYEITEKISGCIKIIYPDVFCKAGCNKCCKSFGSPETFPVEWEKIESYLKNSDKHFRDRIGYSFFELQNSFRNMLKDNKTKTINIIRDEIKCPFLQNEICSIYEIRPLACRMYGSYILRPDSNNISENIIFTCPMEKMRWNVKLNFEKPSAILLPGIWIFLKKMNKLNENRGNTSVLTHFMKKFFEIT